MIGLIILVVLVFLALCMVIEMGKVLLKILPIILLVLIIGFIVNSGTEEKTSSDPEPVQRSPVASARTNTWTRAENKAEVFRRVCKRMEEELAGLGIDGSNLLANAKSHPTHLVSAVPEHKRLRLLVLSHEDESQIARQYVDECRKRELFIEDPAGEARVRAIVERLVPVIPQIETVPAIYLLKDESVNACCLPDGTVFVNTGTLETISDDDLLAAILAHELGHAAARHGNEGLTRILKASAAGVVFEEWALGLAPALNDDLGVSIVRVVYGLGADVGYVLPKDRRAELEADRLGTRYLARAGFPPEASRQLMEYFERIDPQNPKSFGQLFSSHPLNVERIDHISEVLKEPDLREMPKETLLDKLKGKADQGDWIQSATNALPHLPKIPGPWGRKSDAEGSVDSETESDTSSEELDKTFRQSDGEQTVP